MDVKTDRFNYQDAGLVHFDRDGFPHNIGSVAIFEGDIGFQEYLPHVSARLDLVPRYRQRMVRAPFDLAAPRWRDDPDVDLRYHVRPVTLPSPGSDAQLARLAGEFFAEPLDRGRPLWQILLVQGLQGGRTAQLVKAHHCLVDGVGGVQLLLALLDLTPEPPPGSAVPQRERAPLPNAVTRFVDGVCDQLIDQIDAAESLTLALLEPASMLRWGRSVASALGAARPYLVKRPPDTPWNTKLIGPRRLAWQHVPLQETREICKALGGKVNDVALTVIAGALRRYFQLHGWNTEGVVLRVAVPVNMRSDAEARALGNHISMMVGGLPLGVDDPRERFRLISREMAALKAADQAGGLGNLLRVLGRLPSPVQAGLGKTLTAPNIFTNLICTNVRGPETPLYLLGHTMEAHYPWVLNTWRMGLSVALMSYRRDLHFSFTGDGGVLNDIDRVAQFLEQDFGALHDAIAPQRSLQQAPPAQRAVVVAPAHRESAVASPVGPQAATGGRTGTES